MLTSNQLNQPVKFSLAIVAPFPPAIIVRKPKNMAWRLAEGDSILTEISTKRAWSSMKRLTPLGLRP